MATGLGPSSPGFNECCCGGGCRCSIQGGEPTAAEAGSPEPPSPLAFPAIPEPRAPHHCGGDAPGGSKSPVTCGPRQPHPGSCPPTPAEMWRQRGGAEGGRVEGSGGTGRRKDPPGNQHSQTCHLVLSSKWTAQTPPIYLLTVSHLVELSLQSSFQLSLTILVDYGSRSSCYLALDGVYHPFWAAFPSNREDPGQRARGRYHPHTFHRLGLDQKDLDPHKWHGEWVFRMPHFPRPSMGQGFSAGLFPVHSLLLRESWLVSFPQLICLNSMGRQV